MTFPVRRRGFSPGVSLFRHHLCLIEIPGKEIGVMGNDAFQDFTYDVLTACKPATHLRDEELKALVAKAAGRFLL